VIRQSDRLAIVITPELPAIHNAIRSIQYLTSLHYPDDNIDIVLNRYSRKNPLSEREIESSLHRQIAVKVPNDYDLIVNAMNAGTPIDLARKSELAAAFDTWAERYLASEPGAEKAGKGSRKLFSLFGS
jgi:pilus assembly protein CpaE